jgi:hypothetical protein
VGKLVSCAAAIPVRVTRVRRKVARRMGSP